MNLENMKLNHSMNTFSLSCPVPYDLITTPSFFQRSLPSGIEIRCPRSIPSLSIDLEDTHVTYAYLEQHSTCRAEELEEDCAVFISGGPLRKG